MYPPGLHQNWCCAKLLLILLTSAWRLGDFPSVNHQPGVYWNTKHHQGENWWFLVLKCLKWSKFRIIRIIGHPESQFWHWVHQFWPCLFTNSSSFLWGSTLLSHSHLKKKEIYPTASPPTCSIRPGAERPAAKSHPKVAGKWMFIPQYIVCV